MPDVDPEAFSWWDWWLYAFALYCAAGTVYFWFRFADLEAKAKTGGADDVARFNRVLKGFPNAIYAKMLGRRALEASGERE